ncbi:hypothetical protein IPP75_01830 [Candidatus Saccharibacteria bacterium]|nr:MAG: hypothetical protein IPP75_01830 [Candidatus Saccharibacteria bacterium]
MRNVQKWAPVAFIATALVIVLGLALVTISVGGNAAPGWLAAALLIGTAVWLARRPRRPLPPSLQERLGVELAERGVMHAVAGTVEEEAPTQELPPAPEPTPTHDEPGDDPVVQRALRHWISQLPSLLVAAGSLVALVVVRANEDNGVYGWVIAILVMIGFGIIVLRPYFAAVEKVGEAYRRLRGIKRTTIAWTSIGIGCLIAAFVLWWYQAQVSLDLSWLWSALVWLAERLWGLAQAVFQSPATAMTVVIAFAFIKMVFSLLVWASNPIVITEASITAVSGILRKSEPKVDFDQITDLTPVYPFKLRRIQLPWCTLKVETAGQNQGFDEIPWFPTKYLRYVKT